MQGLPRRGRDDCPPGAAPRPQVRHASPGCAQGPRARAHELHVERTYGLSAEDYAAIYEAQGGRCFICQRATGASMTLRPPLGDSR
jgi:hypothetical protein